MTGPKEGGSQMGPPGPHRTISSNHLPAAGFGNSKAPSHAGGAHKPAPSAAQIMQLNQPHRKGGFEVHAKTPNPCGPRTQPQQHQRQQQQQQQRPVAPPRDFSPCAPAVKPGNLFAQHSFTAGSPQGRRGSGGAGDRGLEPNPHSPLQRQQQQQQPPQARQPRQLQPLPAQQQHQEVIELLSSDDEEGGEGLVPGQGQGDVLALPCHALPSGRGDETSAQDDGLPWGQVDAHVQQGNLPAFVPSSTSPPQGTAAKLTHKRNAEGRTSCRPSIVANAAAAAAAAAIGSVKRRVCDGRDAAAGAEVRPSTTKRARQGPPLPSAYPIHTPTTAYQPLLTPSTPQPSSPHFASQLALAEPLTEACASAHTMEDGPSGCPTQPDAGMRAPSGMQAEYEGSCPVPAGCQLPSQPPYALPAPPAQADKDSPVSLHASPQQPQSQPLHAQPPPPPPPAQRALFSPLPEIHPMSRLLPVLRQRSAQPTEGVKSGQATQMEGLKSVEGAEGGVFDRQAAQGGGLIHQRQGRAELRGRGAEALEGVQGGQAQQGEVLQQGVLGEGGQAVREPLTPWQSIVGAGNVHEDGGGRCREEQRVPQMWQQNQVLQEEQHQQQQDRELEHPLRQEGALAACPLEEQAQHQQQQPLQQEPQDVHDSCKGQEGACRPGLLELPPPCSLMAAGDAADGEPGPSSAVEVGGDDSSGEVLDSDGVDGGGDEVAWSASLQSEEDKLPRQGRQQQRRQRGKGQRGSQEDERAQQQEQQLQLFREEQRQKYLQEKAKQEEEEEAQKQAAITTTASQVAEPAGAIERREEQGERAGGRRKRQRRERGREQQEQSPPPPPPQQQQPFQVLSDAALFRGLSFMYPPEDSARAMQVHAIDLERLEEDAFLNDTVMDFYLRVIEHSLPRHSRGRYYFFNSFFYKKLTEKQPTPPASQGPSNNASPKGSQGHFFTPMLEGVSRMLWRGKDNSNSSSGNKRGGDAAQQRAVNGMAAAQRAQKDYDRVSKWTKKVDIFSKDYLLVPIHDTLHWSLAIVCHPGAVRGSLAQEEGVTPCILHLDSMEGGHDSNTVCSTLRSYLFHEWVHKAKTVKGSVPYTWQQQEQQPCSQGSQPYLPFTSEKDCPHRRVNTVPRQNNLCDCGLFALAYAEFFCHGDPNQVTIRQLPVEVQRKKSTMEAHLHSYASLVPLQPDFLAPNWFIIENVTALRLHLKYLVFKHMLEQANSASAHQRAELQERVDEYEQRKATGRPGNCYLPPSEYIQWTQAAREREQAEEAKRKQEEQDAEMARMLAGSDLQAAPPLPLATGRTKRNSAGINTSRGYSSSIFGINDGEDGEDGSDEAEQTTSAGSSDAEEHIARLDSRKGMPGPWIDASKGRGTGRGNTISRGARSISGNSRGKQQARGGSRAGRGQGNQKGKPSSTAIAYGVGGRQSTLPLVSRLKQQPVLGARGGSGDASAAGEHWEVDSSDGEREERARHEECRAGAQSALEKAADRRSSRYKGAVESMQQSKHLLPPPSAGSSRAPPRACSGLSPEQKNALAEIARKREQQQQKQQSQQLQSRLPNGQQQEQHRPSATLPSPPTQPSCPPSALPPSPPSPPSPPQAHTCIDLTADDDAVHSPVLPPNPGISSAPAPAPADQGISTAPADHFSVPSSNQGAPPPPPLALESVQGGGPHASDPTPRRRAGRLQQQQQQPQEQPQISQAPAPAHVPEPARCDVPHELTHSPPKHDGPHIHYEPQQQQHESVYSAAQSLQGSCRGQTSHQGKPGREGWLQAGPEQGPHQDTEQGPRQGKRGRDGRLQAGPDVLCANGSHEGGDAAEEGDESVVPVVKRVNARDAGPSLRVSGGGSSARTSGATCEADTQEMQDMLGLV